MSTSPELPPAQAPTTGQGIPGAVWTILLHLLLPNAFFYALAYLADVGRPYINLDYALVIFLMLAGLRRLGILFFLLLMLIDLLLIAAQIFPVIRLSDILYLGKFFLISSGTYQAIALSILLLVMLKCLALYRLVSRTNEYVGATIFGLLALLYLLDIRSGPTDQLRGTFMLSSHYPVASQLTNFLDYRASKFIGHVRQEGEPFTAIPVGSSAVSMWSGLHSAQATPDRLLLIVVESWGVPHQPEIQEALLKPLRTLMGARLEQGVLPFNGVTVGGELRELCQLAPNHFNLAPVLHGFEQCLPNRLKAQGYKTLAMHGAVSLMYDRRDWYPRAGFEESIFYESRNWPERCHSFPGACDLDMMSEVANYFSVDGKRFMYWLTLNSHPMYDARDIRGAAFDCAEFLIAADSRACRYLKLQAQFFNGMGHLLSDETMRGVQIMLVGDHQPHLIESQNHKPLFEHAKVPWLSVVVN